jgi:hypothetical protein
MNLKYKIKNNILLMGFESHYNIPLCNIPSMLQSIVLRVVHHWNPLIQQQSNWNHEDLISIINESEHPFNLKQGIVYK